MEWIINNWSFLVIVLCAIGVFVWYTKKFVELPSEEQLAKVREWLLFTVMIVEKEYSSGTGALKLRAAYNEFCRVFPSLVPIISFELFSGLVDEALEQMKHILETNKDIEFYVKGEQNGI